MKMKRKEIFNFNADITQVVLQIVGVILLFTVGIQRGDGSITVSNWTTFKWYTTDSNLLMLVVSIISIVYMILKWKGKIKDIPLWVQIAKLCVTAMLILTMCVILGYTALYFIAPNQRIDMTVAGVYMGSNLIHHVIAPVCAIVSYLLFENNKDIKFKHTFICLAPTIAYGIFYMVMAYTHQISDKVFEKGYDWYKFCSFGAIATPFVAIGVIGFYYFATWILWWGNRKINLKFLQEQRIKRRLHK